MRVERDVLSVLMNLCLIGKLQQARNQADNNVKERLRRTPAGSIMPDLKKTIAFPIHGSQKRVRGVLHGQNDKVCSVGTAAALLASVIRVS